MWTWSWHNRKSKKNKLGVSAETVEKVLPDVGNPPEPPNGKLYYMEQPKYVEPTDKEIIEGLEFQDNYEAAGLITHLKKQNMILKGKLTKLTKKYEASEADRKMYIQQLNHLHGHGETE